MTLAYNISGVENLVNLTSDFKMEALKITLEAISILIDNFIHVHVSQKYVFYRPKM